MATARIFTCDSCGVKKGETNHWWLVDRMGAKIVIAPWDDSDALALGVSHLCGSECVHSQISKWMLPEPVDKVIQG